MIDRQTDRKIWIRYLTWAGSICMFNSTGSTMFHKHESLSPLTLTKRDSKAFRDLPPSAHCLWTSALTSSLPELGLGEQILRRVASKAPGVNAFSACRVEMGNGEGRCMWPLHTCMHVWFHDSSLGVSGVIFGASCVVVYAYTIVIYIYMYSHHFLHLWLN